MNTQVSIMFLVSYLVLCSGLRLLGSGRVNTRESRVELVVAAYNEDLSFVDMMKPYIPNAKAKVYCAGPASDSRCIQVENLQDGTAIYLKHVIDNYDTGLAPITLFSLGSTGKSEWNYLLCRKLYYVISKLDTVEKQVNFSGFATMAHTSPDKFLGFDRDFDISSYRAYSGQPQVQHCRPRIHPLGEWYKHFVDSDLNQAESIGVSFNNIFAVSAERIKKWPKSTYQALFQELYICKGTRATAAHYMERTFKPMWDTDPPQNRQKHAIPGPNECPIKEQLSKKRRGQFFIESEDEWLLTSPE